MVALFPSDLPFFYRSPPILAAEHRSRPEKIIGAEAQLVINNMNLSEESSSWKLKQVEVSQVEARAPQL